MRVAKWGNSLAVRLPAKFAEEHGLKEGDEIQFGVAEGPGPVFEVEKKPSRKELIERLARNGGWLPAGFKFNREEANEVDRLHGYRTEPEE